MSGKTSVRVAVVALPVLMLSALAGFGQSGSGDRMVGYRGRQYALRTDSFGWSLWQGDVLRWRVTGPPPTSGFAPEVEGRDEALEQIASWACPGDVFTGGQLHVWDLDGDSRPELALSNWGASTYVYKATGDDQFEAVHQLSNPVGSYYTTLVCAGDGDSDGLAELVYSTGTSGVPRDLFFVESEAPGQYPSTVVLELPEVDIGVNQMRMTDLDGDGLREYVGTTGGTHDKLLAIWENRGDNAYARVYSAHFGPPNATSGESTTGDFDRDGKQDLVVLENSGVSDNIIHVLENNGDDSYQEVWSTNAPTDNTYWVTAGPDLDQDGMGDFVVTGGVGFPTAAWSFLMYEADGDNSYRLAWSYHIQSAIIDAGASTGDLDGDRRNELVCQVPNRTMAFRAAGNDLLELFWEHVGPVVGQENHRLVAPDLDGDGYGEAVWWTADEPGAAVVYESSTPAAVFADGFELGNTSAWTSTMP